MKKVLITGSEGFVGKNLIRYLKNYPFKIIKTSDHSYDLKLSESWKQFEKMRLFDSFGRQIICPTKLARTWKIYKKQYSSNNKCT